MDTTQEQIHPLQADDPAIERARLAWRCRRGMLELDLLLRAFLERGYDRLEDEERLHFFRLLDFSDQELLELLLEQKMPEDTELNHVIAKIRSTA